MLNFHQIVFRKFIIVFSILFIVIGGIVYYWTKEFYIEQTKLSLLNDIELISFELQKSTNLDKLAQEIRKNLNLRLTVIDKDGKVIAESHKDKSKMDNHKNRDEILQASNQDFGYKIRHSRTLNKDLLYVAKLYNINGRYLYIRLSRELQSIHRQVISLGFKVLSVLSIFFIVMFVLAYKLSKDIESEMKNIANFLTSLVKKKKSTYISSSFSKEFADITMLLSKVSKILTKKEKQKAKYTKRLQVANKQKDDIISAISHEFKNPIAIINGYTQTLLEDKELDVQTRERFLQKIYKNGEKLTSLIDTIRLSVRLEGTKQKLKLSACNIYELISDVVESIKPNYANRKTIIKGDKDIIIQVDEALFGIALSNIIENAYKYSEDEVIIEFDSKKICIIDRGIGIEQKNLQNITDKFYRVSNNVWNNSLGLGLFIVDNIVQLHGFELDVKSKENEGSVFCIKIV